jgi:hypothetical protein
MVAGTCELCDGGSTTGRLVGACIGILAGAVLVACFCYRYRRKAAIAPTPMVLATSTVADMALLRASEREGDMVGSNNNGGGHVVTRAATSASKDGGLSRMKGELKAWKPAFKSVYQCESPPAASTLGPLLTPCSQTCRSWPC